MDAPAHYDSLFYFAATGHPDLCGDTMIELLVVMNCVVPFMNILLGMGYTFLDFLTFFP